MTDTLGERIQKARVAKGFARQQDLADLVANGRAATISEWEKDVKAPSYEKLVELVRALEVSGHWLLTGQGQMHRTPATREQQGFEAVRRVVQAFDALDKIPRVDISFYEPEPRPGQDGEKG